MRQRSGGDEVPQGWGRRAEGLADTWAGSEGHGGNWGDEEKVRGTQGDECRVGIGMQRNDKRNGLTKWGLGVLETLKGRLL